jgi:hypothetical protein
MEYLSEQLQQAIQAIREKTPEDAVETVANIFMSIELEFGFLDQKRKDAEEAFSYWLETVQNNNLPELDKENEESENYVNTSE